MLQGELIGFDLQIWRNLKKFVNFGKVNQSWRVLINFRPNTNQPLWGIQWALAIEDVAFYSRVRGEYKTSWWYFIPYCYSDYTLWCVVEVERRKNAAAGCRKCKKSLFQDVFFCHFFFVGRIIIFTSNVVAPRSTLGKGCNTPHPLGEVSFNVTTCFGRCAQAMQNNILIYNVSV